MSAVRMDGKALSAKVRGSILAETEELKKQGVTPGLAVIIVGNDPASEIYVRNKERACEQCGFYSEKYALPEETTQEELLGLIAQLNESPAISGILCQMPVPKHISEQAVIDAIDPKKDVDAFHPVNVGKIMVGKQASAKAAAPKQAAPAPAPAAAKPAAPEAPGTAGELKLYGTPDRDAALIMAIVAHKMGKPLNTLRFKSIKEVQ